MVTLTLLRQIQGGGRAGQERGAPEIQLQNGTEEVFLITQCEYPAFIRDRIFQALTGCSTFFQARVSIDNIFNALFHRLLLLLRERLFPFVK